MDLKTGLDAAPGPTAQQDLGSCLIVFVISSFLRSHRPGGPRRGAQAPTDSEPGTSTKYHSNLIDTTVTYAVTSQLFSSSMAQARPGPGVFRSSSSGWGRRRPPSPPGQAGPGLVTTESRSPSVPKSRGPECRSPCLGLAGCGAVGPAWTQARRHGTRRRHG